MLQIIIVTDGHYQYIQEIKVDNSTLVEFDVTTNKIALEPVTPYLGQQAMISHYVKEGDDLYLDYEHVQTINAVDKDEDGLWFIEWSE